VDVFGPRKELRGVRGKVLRVTINQKEQNCILGGFCQFKFLYKGIGFCASEILGQGCQMEFDHKLLINSSNGDSQSENRNTKNTLQLTLDFKFTDFPP
jgi:hypothetical protein